MTLPWRTLTCRKCRRPVQVLELPRVYIDPAEFCCGGCLKEKA